MVEIVNIGDRKSKKKRVKITINMRSGEVMEILCDHFGAYIDNPELLVFLDGDLEVEALPHTMVNSRDIVFIKYDYIEE